jgi:hypothetical protein
VRSVQLQETLAAFLEQAAARLQADVLAGSEVPFDLETRTARRAGRRSPVGASLYCYRPLTQAFIAERYDGLRRLDAYAPALAQLERCDTLERYLLARGVDAPRRGERHADAVLLALLHDVFEDQTDFSAAWLAQHPERLERVLEQLDGSALPRAGEVTLLATLHGLAISSPEIALARGLSLAQPDALRDVPEQALRACSGDRGGLLVHYTAADASSGADGVAEGVAVMHELLRGLRLFGDGRIALGTRAFARVGESQWSTIALGAGGHPHGVLLVTAEQEDELRAFCNLISRRAGSGHAAGSASGHQGGAIAWALRRFELGCDRACEYEGLSDHLLALRALLSAPAELAPSDLPDGLLAGRLAALCAPPERRSELAERTLAAIALERETIAGTAVQRAGGLVVARDLADHLRALLRDVICGHLPVELAPLADEILLAADTAQDASATDERPAASDEQHATSDEVHAASDEQHAASDEVNDGQLALSEQVLGDQGDTAEVLRVAV